MTRSEWEALVTRQVDELAGPNFEWDAIDASEWEAAWLRRLSVEEFAAKLAAETPA